jgi:hypothetical protein
MKKNNLKPNEGLSLSQAQSISNLCNQRASEIDNLLSSINNFSKTIIIGDKTHTLQKACPMPNNIIDLLKEKSRLHACQAFLMENIKAKDNMLKEIKNKQADISSIKTPDFPEEIYPDVLSQVDESFGWEQLTASELNEYMEAEAYASHIGKFIHNKSVLDSLRKELSTIPSIEWMEVRQGEKTPVDINVHHTSKQLMDIHEELATLHRKYEQVVNRFKAKVKNLTTEENARISKLNSDAQSEASKNYNILIEDYNLASKKVQEEIKNIRAKFEEERQASIKEIVSTRIKVDDRFQSVVDMFLDKLPKTENE